MAFEMSNCELIVEIFKAYGERNLPFVFCSYWCLCWCDCDEISSFFLLDFKVLVTISLAACIDGCCCFVASDLQNHGDT